MTRLCSLFSSLLLLLSTVQFQSSEAAPHLRRTLDEVDGATTSATTRGLIDLVHLVPFDVQIAVTQNNGIRVHEVSNIVTEWMNDSYKASLEDFGYTDENGYAEFDSVVLYTNENRGRSLQATVTTGGELYTAKFKGGVVFSRNESSRTKSVPENDVLLIQQMTLLNDRDLSLRLQNSDKVGLGSVVVDVNAFLNPNQPEPESDNKSLQIVIVIAIVVACVAFCFLLGAVYWAYWFDKHNHNGNNHRSSPEPPSKKKEQRQGDPDKTDSTLDETPEKIRRRPNPYPDVVNFGSVDDSNYPESVISDSVVSESVLSEDVSASLSQYYRAGMGKIGTPHEYQSGMLNDAGSVSSMESYGYSLDGGGATMSTPLPMDLYVDTSNNNRERIGGLPIEPDDPQDGSSVEVDVEDVQIPDLDKELANLDIILSPSASDDDGDGSQSSSGLPAVSKTDDDDQPQPITAETVDSQSS